MLFCAREKHALDFHTGHVNHRLTYWLGGHDWNGSITRVAMVHVFRKTLHCGHPAPNGKIVLSFQPCWTCRRNRLPTTHQLHAATPPLTDLLAALLWTYSGVNWSSEALTCIDCTITQVRLQGHVFASTENHGTCCCFAEHCFALICQLRGLAFLIWSAQGPDLFAGTSGKRPFQISSPMSASFVGTAARHGGCAPCKIKKPCRMRFQGSWWE